MRLSYHSAMIRRLGIPILFLTTAFGLVYALPPLVSPLKAEKADNQKAPILNSSAEILRDVEILPAEVNRIRRAILDAAMSGQIEAMRVPIEMNEIPPILAREKLADPIAHWKTVSGDGEGREILATLVQLFRTGFVHKNAGTGDAIYVWPYFAEMPLDALTPAQEVELLMIVPPSRLKAMKASGRYDHYRIGIGHDGTWHYFVDQID
jgi:hypothetical protein